MISFSDKRAWYLVVLLAVLIGDLLLVYLGMRMKHEVIKAENAKREILLNSIAKRIYGLDLNGNCTFCIAATLELFGFRGEHELVEA